MKKIYSLLLGFVFIGITAKAQYFDHIYGSTSYEEINSGMNTVAMGKGFVFGGIRTSTTGNVAASVVRADINGNIPASPYFKKSYGTYLDNTLTTVLKIRQSQVIELNSTRFGVVGVCYKDATLTKMQLYYAPIDNTGTPLASLIVISGVPYNMRTYDLGFDAFFTLRNLRLASSGTEFYIIGSAQSTAFNGPIYSMILKIDIATGNIIWSGVYQVSSTGATSESAYDAVEDPSTGELVVVGFYQSGLTNDDAYCLRLNSATGAVVAPTKMYGTSTTTDDFTCITLPASGSGYIIGGYTGPVNNYDAWAIKLNSTFTPVWTELYDYSNSNSNNTGVDIFERVNTSGNTEDYLGGLVTGGLYGNNDMTVFKITGTTGICSAQFTYGTANSEYFSNIDQLNGSATDGLSVFGQTVYTTSPFANTNYNVYKTYFNGVTSCNYNSTTINSTLGPGFMATLLHVQEDVLHDHYAWFQTVGTFSDLQICSSSSVTGGSNARIAQSADETASGNTIDIYPNPSSDNFFLNVNIDGEKEITVIDFSGRTVYYNTTSEKTVSLNLSDNAAGMYFVKVNVNGNQYVEKIVKY